MYAGGEDRRLSLPRRTARLLAPFLLSGCAAAAQQLAAGRHDYNFNPGWRVFTGDPQGAEQPGFDDASWKAVSTPYAWNEDSAFKVSIHDLPTGVAWYRKHFVLPPEAAGRKVLIEFEGVRQGAEVYLNGHFIGRHEDGVMAFGFDLTPLLKAAPADNVLAVRTDNRWDYKEHATGTTFRWNNNNFYANYGGISKNVWLHVVPPVYETLPLYAGLGTTGTYIWASNFDIAHHRAQIHAETQIRNTTSRPQHIAYDVRILSPNGKTVGSFTGGSATIAPGASTVVSAEHFVDHLQFWSWGYGYLYRVITTIRINGKPEDAFTTRTGFRQTAFQNGMVSLNGRVLDVHGYGQRTTNEWPAVGLSVPPWMSDLSNRLMVESNGNLVRWMHVTPWKQDVESADRVGLIESMPAGDAEGDSSGRHWEQRLDLMRDAIVYNRNNPSILFYEGGNKGISHEHMLEMKAIRDQFDPHGGRAIGAREMLADHTAEYGGEMLYIDKSATKPLWAHEYDRDEGARKFQDNLTAPFHVDSPLYNRNQDSAALEDARRWNDYFIERPGTGTRVSSGGVNIIFSDSNTHYRGDNNYRRSGEVDAMRLPKEGFFAHQVIWNGWVDIEHPGIHILGHWNYDPGTLKPVYVVSTADRVELKLNGRSLGFGSRADTFIFTFPQVAYVPGELEAIGYSADGKIVTSTAIQTAGPVAALKLTLHTGPQGLRADGADMALVDVEAVDKEGRRCPTALNMIHFTLQGAAEWRGGIAQGSATPAPPGPPATPLLYQDNFILSKYLPLEAGVNRILLRSLPRSGAIRLTAKADGLPSAQLQLASHPIPVRGGLSQDFPSNDQPLNLERGPTPATPSFTVKRVQLPIASATAGANSQDAHLSFDDDETTSWSNADQEVSDGLPPKHGDDPLQERPKTAAALGQAWIDYDLGQPEPVTGLDLKLNGFRRRRYPLRITLDGQTVWEGLTPTTLGYCTLPITPAKGRHLRIALTGAPLDVQEAPANAEITGKMEQAGNQALGKPGAPVLSILEVDVFKAPTP